jgi:hypothetical protein
MIHVNQENLLQTADHKTARVPRVTASLIKSLDASFYRAAAINLCK